MMMGCWNFFRQIEKLTLLLFTRHFVNNNHGGGDIPPPWMAVAVVMLQITSCFFPDSSRLCSIYDRMSCDFFFYLNTFLTRRSGITFGSFFGNEVIYTTTVNCDVHKKFFSRSWLDMVWTNLMPLTTDRAEDEKNQFLLFRAKCRNNSKKIFNFQSKKQKDVARLLKKRKITAIFSLQWILK